MADQQLGSLHAKLTIDSSALAATQAKAEAFGGSLIGTFGKIAAAAGIGFGLEKVVSLIDSSVKSAARLETAQSNVKQVFGTSAGVVEQFSLSSVKALGQTQEAALGVSGALGRMLIGFGIAAPTAANDVLLLQQRIADLSSTTGTTQEAVTEAIQAGLRGRGAALKNYGIVIDNTKLAQEALLEGLIKAPGETEKYRIAVEKLKIAQEQYNAVVAGTPGRAGSTTTTAASHEAIALATEKATLAQERYTAAVAKSGAGSIAAQSASISAQSAVDSLQRLEAGHTSVTRAIAGHHASTIQLQQAQLRLQQAQDAVNAASTAAVPKLSDQAKAQAALGLILKDSAGAAGDFGKSAADKMLQFHAGIEEAKTSLGVGLLPVVRQFTDWAATHQTDITNFATAVGQDLGTAAHDLGDAFKWIGDHKDAVLPVIGALTALYAAHKLSSPVGAIVGDVKGLLGLSGLGGGGGGGIGGVVASLKPVDVFVVNMGVGGLPGVVSGGGAAGAVGGGEVAASGIGLGALGAGASIAALVGTAVAISLDLGGARTKLQAFFAPITNHTDALTKPVEDLISHLQVSDEASKTIRDALTVKSPRFVLAIEQMTQSAGFTALHANQQAWLMDALAKEIANGTLKTPQDISTFATSWEKASNKALGLPPPIDQVVQDMHVAEAALSKAIGDIITTFAGVDAQMPHVVSDASIIAGSLSQAASNVLLLPQLILNANAFLAGIPRPLTPVTPQPIPPGSTNNTFNFHGTNVNATDVINAWKWQQAHP